MTFPTRQETLYLSCPNLRQEWKCQALNAMNFKFSCAHGSFGINFLGVGIKVKSRAWHGDVCWSRCSLRVSHLPSWLGTEDSPRTPESSRQTGTAGCPAHVQQLGQGWEEAWTDAGACTCWRLGRWYTSPNIPSSFDGLWSRVPARLRRCRTDILSGAWLTPARRRPESSLLALRMHPSPDCGCCSPDCQAEEAQPAPSCLPPRACPWHSLRGHQRKHRPFVRAGLLWPLAVTTSLLSWLFILFEKRTSSKSEESHTVLYQQRSDWIQTKPRGPICNAFCFLFNLDFTWIWRVKGVQGLK